MDVEGRQFWPGPRTRSVAAAATREAQRLRWGERQRRCRSRRVRRADGERDAGGVQPPLAEGIDGDVLDIVVLSRGMLKRLLIV
jgi:hypothetical protein